MVNKKEICIDKVLYIILGPVYMKLKRMILVLGSSWE